MPTQNPSFPDPIDDVPGLEPGGGVRPGDTPPASDQATSATGVPQDAPTPGARKWPIGWLVAIGVVVVLVAGMFIVMAVLRAQTL